MGIKQANRIEETLSRARQDGNLLEAFFTARVSTAARAEPLFVTNLELVQGDEGDAIIQTSEYTKETDGRLMYRFGPPNNACGERWLDVAVTRARRYMTVLSSFTDPDLTKLRAEGPGCCAANWLIPSPAMLTRATRRKTSRT